MTAALLLQDLDRLAKLEPCYPLLSLYLNTEVDGNGHHTHGVFERKAIHEILKEYEERSSERESLEDDAGRIARCLAEELAASTRGLAIGRSFTHWRGSTTSIVAAPRSSSWLAGGRAVVGVDETRRALRDGQVDTLLIAAAPVQPRVEQ